VVGTWKASLEKSKPPELSGMQYTSRGQKIQPSYLSKVPRALSFPTLSLSLVPKQRGTITSLSEMGNLVQDG